MKWVLWNDSLHARDRLFIPRSGCSEAAKLSPVHLSALSLDRDRVLLVVDRSRDADTSSLVAIARLLAENARIECSYSCSPGQRCLQNALSHHGDDHGGT